MEDFLFLCFFGLIEDLIHGLTESNMINVENEIVLMDINVITTK